MRRFERWALATWLALEPAAGVLRKAWPVVGAVLALALGHFLGGS